MKEQLDINFKNIHTWSDSTIALGCINSSPHRLKTYVANRVVAITEKIPACYWRHVASTDNPADLGSRGTTAGALIQSSLWWKGPSWLLRSPDHWPVKNLQDQVLLPEVKSVAFVLETKQPAEDLSLRYSSFSKFINVISWICRFCSNTTKPQAERIWSSQLTVQEINAAEILLFKQQQAQFFPKEQIALKSGMTVSSSSSIYSLRPILDSEGLIRVGGRLSQSELPYSQQHPIILHRKAHLTELLVQCLHVLHLHAGPTLLLGIVSLKYYVVGARQLLGMCLMVVSLAGKPMPGQLPNSWETYLQFELNHPLLFLQLA